MNKKMNPTLKALIQSWGFKLPHKKGGLPTINFVYPSFTADGLSEEFRFSQTLEAELRERASVVTNAFAGKDVIRTSNEHTLLRVDLIAPRLRLGEQIRNEVNSIYPYAPLLFVAMSPDDSTTSAIFVVKPLIDTSMAWFELTEDEARQVHQFLVNDAETLPYRGFWKNLGYRFLTLRMPRSFKSSPA